MSISTFVRRHVYHMVGDRPFSIRDCLIYGSRNAVDQVFHRLVKTGIIVRLAQGIYIKSLAPKPSLHEIAKIKAAAFGKTIATHGADALQIVKERAYLEKFPNRHRNLENKAEMIYAVTGHTSSFRYGNILVRFIGTSIRRMKLEDHPVGLLIRALAHLGKQAVDPQIISDTAGQLGRIESEMLRRSVNLMPAWMQNSLRLPIRWPYPLSKK